jgi:hypothetical protein
VRIKPATAELVCSAAGSTWKIERLDLKAELTLGNLLRL